MASDLVSMTTLSLTSGVNNTAEFFGDKLSDLAVSTILLSHDLVA